MADHHCDTIPIGPHKSTLPTQRRLSDEGVNQTLPLEDLLALCK